MANLTLLYKGKLSGPDPVPIDIDFLQIFNQCVDQLRLKKVYVEISRF